MYYMYTLHMYSLHVHYLYSCYICNACTMYRRIDKAYYINVESIFCIKLQSKYNVYKIDTLGQNTCIA